MVEIGRCRFDRGGGSDRFGHAEHDPRGEEGGDRGGKGMRHAGQTPDQHAKREAKPQTDAIEEPAGAEKGKGGRDLERGAHVGIILIGPAELRLERGLQQREDLPVDIIEHDRDEHHRHDDPARRPTPDPKCHPIPLPSFSCDNVVRSRALALDPMLRHPGLVPGSTAPQTCAGPVCGTVDAGTSPA